MAPKGDNIQYVKGLVLEMCAEPSGQLPDGADPLTWIDRVADPVYAAVGCTEIRITAKHRKIKKTGAPACANALVRDQCLDELPVNAAAWIVHHLFDL